MSWSQELLRQELARLDRREDDSAVAELCREMDCQPGELAFKLNGLRRKHKDDDAEIGELERNNDDLGAANTDLTEEIERLRQRSVDFSKVDETLARLKEAGPKVVNLQVTMEIGESET
jgi:seryl-tRNA synthetase